MDCPSAVRRWQTVTIGLLIAAEMRLYREGLACLLERDPGLVVLKCVARCSQLHDYAVSLRPHVAVVDLAMPDALREVKSLRSSAPGLRVVGLAVLDDDSMAVACAEIGLDGWVARDASLEDLTDAIQAAARDELHCTPRTAAALARRLATLSAEREPGPPSARLTAREHEILSLIEEGLSNKEIAARLMIALPTVKNHVHHILDKLDARGRVEAIMARRTAAGAHGS